MARFRARFSLIFQVDPDTKIKVKPNKSVPGKAVVVFFQGTTDLIAFADVKVYVKPKPKNPAPGEPEGPGGPDGPEGPEVTT